MMYAISDAHRAEILTLLRTIVQTTGLDIASVNRRRKAALLVKKLNNAKPYGDAIKRSRRDATLFGNGARNGS